MVSMISHILIAAQKKIEKNFFFPFSAMSVKCRLKRIKMNLKKILLIVLAYSNCFIVKIFYFKPLFMHF